MYQDDGHKELFLDQLGLWIAFLLLVVITAIDIKFLIWFIPQFINFLLR